MNKLFLWGFVAGIVVILGAIVFLAGQNQGVSSGGGENLSVPVSIADHFKGPEDASVVLVEYGDFQCPACASAHPVVQRLAEQYEGLKIVYRHFPLQAHAHAKAAAQASEAAARQGKFWELHDILFERQADWSKGGADEKFEAYAAELGLDIERFRADRDSQEIVHKVQSDFDGGVASGVNATPSFYLQGKKIVNSSIYEEVGRAVSQSVDSP